MLTRQTLYRLSFRSYMLTYMLTMLSVMMMCVRGKIRFVVFLLFLTFWPYTLYAL